LGWFPNEEPRGRRTPLKINPNFLEKIGVVFLGAKTGKGQRKAKRNPNRNQETIILDLFSFEDLKKRDRTIVS